MENVPLNFIVANDDVPCFIVEDALEKYPKRFHSCIKAFRDNERSNSILAGIPVLASGISALYEHFFCAAIVKDGRKPGNFESSSRSIRTLQDWQNARSLLVNWMETTGEPDWNERLRSSGMFTVMGMESQHSNIRTGLISTLKAVLTGSWTAFEVLSADLWIAALNQHPDTLANLSGKWWKGLQKGTSVEYEGENDEKQEDGERKIELSQLCKNGFNLSEKMGDVLSRCFRWNTLGGIIKAYGSAFSKHEKEIKAILAKPALRAIAAARNCIVHKGGRVDRSFFRQIGEWPAFATSKEGETIPLTGEIVHDLRVQTIEAGVSLIDSVVDWVKTH